MAANLWIKPTGGTFYRPDGLIIQLTVPWSITLPCQPVNAQKEKKEIYQEILDELVEKDDLHAASSQRDLDIKRMHVQILLTLRSIIVQCYVQCKYIVTTKRQDLNTHEWHTEAVHSTTLYTRSTQRAQTSDERQHNKIVAVLPGYG